MTDEKRCEWCVSFRVKRVDYEGEDAFFFSCALDCPLKPCEFYEREPGADDDREASDVR